MATVLTSENSAEFYAQKLGLEPPVAPVKPEEPVVESAPKPEAEPAVEADEQHPDPEKKQRINLRFSELTQARKEAEAKAEKAEAEAKTLREAKALAEQRANELQAKYEPPKDPLGPEPKREQFVSDAEHLEAVKDWAGDKAVAEKEQKDAQAQIEKTWNERVAATRAEIPDYDAVIAANANLQVSNQVRDAILDSEVGPKILLHLAKNPDLVSKLAEMKLGPALKAIGKLEGKFEAAPAPKETPKLTVVPASENIRAPEVISPLKGGNAVVDAPVDASGNITRPLTAREYRELRKAGKIN